LAQRVQQQSVNPPNSLRPQKTRVGLMRPGFSII